MGSSNLIPLFVHYRALVHKDNAVTVEIGIMHELKASALSTRDGI